MSAAVAAILEGMPEPGDLRMHQVDGRCVITAGSVVLFDFDEADIGMRNLALVSLRSLGFRGRAVAAVLGLTEAYVSTLWSAARRDGSAAVLSGQLRRGKPGTVTPEQWEQARAWRAEVPVTPRSGGGWAWRTPRSAAAWGNGRKRPLRRRRG